MRTADSAASPGSVRSVSRSDGSGGNGSAPDPTASATDSVVTLPALLRNTRFLSHSAAGAGRMSVRSGIFVDPVANSSHPRRHVTGCAGASALLGAHLYPGRG